ncbi:MAG: carbohydrate-binding family 9-like protein [Planctomycetes bacterium]|nr:carbohydrate-binding family 9-like protein [Planctomycetota bacterium]
MWYKNIFRKLFIAVCLFLILLVLLLNWRFVSNYPIASSDEPSRPELTVKATEDFEVDGNGTNAAWHKSEWVKLNQRGQGPQDYEARFKALHSKTGLYFLMEGTDRRLTTTLKEDFLDLWNEDVFEVFLWTDERYPVYFEYEISPLNFELPILIPNFDGKFLGWRPWHYEGARQIRKRTAAIGGPKEPGAEVQGWRAEFFIPHELLRPLQNVPPRPGARWRANFYRVDHDGGKSTGWDWARVGSSFHEYQKFGTLIFE